MKKLFLFLAIAFIICCSKGNEKENETSVKGWIPTYKLIGDSSTWTTANKDALIKTPEAAAIIAKAAVKSIYVSKSPSP
ncbi:MAG: hypothetical protein IKX22_05000 [Prevotella sp.]|nr:hypothetical protein [Prevotella sp.]